MLCIAKSAILKRHGNDKYPTVSKSDHRPLLVSVKSPVEKLVGWVKKNDNLKGCMPEDTDKYRQQCVGALQTEKGTVFSLNDPRTVSNFNIFNGDVRKLLTTVECTTTSSRKKLDWQGFSKEEYVDMRRRVKWRRKTIDHNSKRG